MHEKKSNCCLSQGLLPLTYKEAQIAAHLQGTAIRLGGRIPRPCQRMALASSNNVVREKPTGEWTVDSCPHTVLIGIVNHPTKVPVYFQPSGLGYTRGRIQESIGHIDHVKHARINELPHLIRI